MMMGRVMVALPPAAQGKLQGLMVARDHQLELRLILEKILVHEPCGDCISTRHAFDFGLSPAPTFLDFVNGNQPRSAQHGQIGWVAVAHSDNKSL